ncbi:hypothetical protein PHK61_21215 [Actinomycetospora lutea]|uniref:hypothetical protein n=1 Tax=Actinomycetospora lutea TaxID=663604 RepID=UPI002366FF32|nr:hypothetical protein [Actinomycetospora lutea]MDD7940944.1 hypothetical protein [Actinomycetospora lutea]
MGILRKSVMAAALIGAGLTSTTGAAFAQESVTQDGMGNVNEVQTIVPTNVCNNDVPVNVLGVQVPVEDVSGAVPILSDADGAAAQPESQSCGNKVHADN